MPVDIKSLTLSSTTSEKMSRHDMLDWVNETVHGTYRKIEELCSGVAYCQLMELLFPNCIGLKKVKMGAKLEHEYLHNLKLFQAAFSRLNFDKSVPIERLIKGRFQDNFEFLQWFKKFFDTHAAGKENLKVPAALAAAAANAPKPIRKPGTVTQQVPLAAAKPTKTTPTGVVVPQPLRTTPRNNAQAKPQQLRTISPSSERVLRESLEQLSEQVQSVELERNYYYKKLTSIEGLLNISVDQNEHIEWSKRALAILYAVDDSNGSSTLPSGALESADL